MAEPVSSSLLSWGLSQKLMPLQLSEESQTEKAWLGWRLLALLEWNAAGRPLCPVVKKPVNPEYQQVAENSGMFFQLLVEHEPLTRSFGCPLSIAQRPRQCQGGQKSAVCLRDASWCLSLVAQTQVYLSTFCFPRSVCYDDTNLYGLIGGGDDAQKPWGLGMPLFLLNTSSVIFFVLDFTLLLQARNGTNYWLCI